MPKCLKSVKRSLQILPALSKFVNRIALVIRDPRILVLIAPFLLLSPIWAQGKAIFWGTPATQFIPWWVQAWETISNGELPLWNPLLGMGTPLLANYQSALLYPGTWIYFVLYRLGGTALMAWGMAPVMALHLAIAGIGMLFLLRQLRLNKFSQTLGALAFSLSGYLVARANFLSINASVAWLPWILWASYLLIKKRDKKRILYLAILMAIQWLAGHAQIAWYSLLLMALWSLFWMWSDRKRGETRSILGKFSLSLGLAFALSAIQLIPTLEFLIHSARGTQLDPQLVMNYSFWPWRIITLFVPNIFGNPVSGNFWAYGNYWEDAIYIALIPLLLAFSWVLKAKIHLSNQEFRKFLVSIALLGLALALGNNTPLFPWLFEKIPTFDLFQAPTRFNIWLVIVLAILAAFGAQNWRRPQGKKLYWSRLIIAGFVSILFVAIFGKAILGQLGITTEDTFIRSLLSLAIFGLAFAVLNLNAPLILKSNFSRWHYGVILVVIIDLLWAGWGLNPGVNLEFYEEALQAPQLAREIKPGERIYIFKADEDELKFDQFFHFDRFSSNLPISDLRSNLLPNLNVLDGIASANNFDPILINRYYEFIKVLENQNKQNQMKMLAGANVGVLASLDGFSTLQAKTINALGAVRWVNCASLVGNMGEALALLSGSELSNQQIIVEIPQFNDISACGMDPAIEAKISITDRHSNSILLQVDSPSGGWLLITDSFYPGWQAFLDGEAIELFPANLVFRALQLTPGNHEISLSYRPISFYVGAGFSTLALLYLIVALRKIQKETDH